MKTKRPKLTEEELVKYRGVDLTSLPKSEFNAIKNRLPEGYILETKTFTAGFSRTLYPFGIFIKKKPEVKNFEGLSPGEFFLASLKPRRPYQPGLIADLTVTTGEEGEGILASGLKYVQSSNT